MPTRPPEHVLEDQSRAAFAALVQPWVFRDKKPDYGIDAEVEVFDSGKTTGQLFLVQLKATGNLESPPGISLDVEWINYYRSLELPVLIALWAKDLGKFFWTWAGEIDLFYAKPNAKSYTIRLPYEWDAQTLQTIRTHLDLRRRLKAQHIPTPLLVCVECDDAVTLSDLVVQLNIVFANAPRLVQYKKSEADITAALSKDELRIYFRGQPGVVFHSMVGVSAEGVAKRIAIGIVIALANFGALNKAGELWASIPRLAEGVSSVDVAWRVGSILARASADAELLAFVRALEFRLGNVITAPLLTLYFTATPHRKGGLGKVLAELERDHLNLQDPEAKSISEFQTAPPPYPGATSNSSGPTS